MPQTPTVDLQSILDPLDVPKSVKAAAWDAFNSSRNDAEFRIKFAGIKLPNDVKAELWDAKQFTPEQTIQKITSPLKGTDPVYLSDRLINAGKAGLGTVGDVLTGAGQGAGETLMNLGKFARKIPGVSALDSIVPPIEVPEDIVTPKNTAQKVGKGAERVAEFVAGGEAVAPLKAAGLARTASPVLRAAITATTEGAAAAGVTAAQDGAADNVLAPALTAGALSVALPVALKLGGQLGHKIESVLIKPVSADVKDGFNVANVFKYKLGGTLEQTLKKTQDKIEELTALARQMRTASQPGMVRAGQSIPGPVVDLPAVMQQVKRELVAAAPRNQGLNQAIDKAFQKEWEEFAILQNAGHLSPNGEAPIDVAHQVLQSIGERGAWTYGFRDPDSVASEKVANALYSKLREAIEKAIPNGSALKAVNKAMSELIPIKQAIIRRIPVEARNQALHLSDIVSIASGNAPLTIANRALRSGSVANILVKGAENADKLGGVGARVGAASVAVGGRP